MGKDGGLSFLGTFKELNWGSMGFRWLRLMLLSAGRVSRL